MNGVVCQRRAAGRAVLVLSARRPRQNGKASATANHRAGGRSGSKVAAPAMRAPGLPLH